MWETRGSTARTWFGSAPLAEWRILFLQHVEVVVINLFGCPLAVYSLERQLVLARPENARGQIQNHRSPGATRARRQIPLSPDQLSSGAAKLHAEAAIVIFWLNADLDP